MADVEFVNYSPGPQTSDFWLQASEEIQALGN